MLFATLLSTSFYLCKKKHVEAPTLSVLFALTEVISQLIQSTSSL
jgi:hypothetical protein